LAKNKSVIETTHLNAFILQSRYCWLPNDEKALAWQ